MKIFVDDQWEYPDRYPGDGWLCVRTFREAVEALMTHRGKVSHLSLDSDLGDVGTQGGPAIVEWMAEMWFTNQVDFWPTESLTLHTRNSVGRETMKAYALNPNYNPRPEIYQNVLI